MLNLLCITLPRASRTAWEVKFSDGIRLMKCFWRLFSCARHQQSSHGKRRCKRTFCMISNTAGSASARWADRSCNAIR